jgi:hypothetical protein
MDRETGRELDLHNVKRVAEVRVNAANELLDAGWLLHDIYFSNESGDLCSNYIMLSLTDIVCPNCEGPATIEVVDDGERVRYICMKECGQNVTYPALDMPKDRRL